MVMMVSPKKRIIKCRKVCQLVDHKISLRDQSANLLECSCYLTFQETVSLDILEVWHGQEVRTISKLMFSKNISKFSKNRKKFAL